MPGRWSRASLGHCLRECATLMGVPSWSALRRCACSARPGLDFRSRLRLFTSADQGGQQQLRVGARSPERHIGWRRCHPIPSPPPNASMKPMRR